jgi:hypothetical protein
MKTAIQQFIEELETPKWQDVLGKELTMTINENVKLKYIDLEKEQLRNAFYSPTDIQTPKNFDDYYNETFGLDLRTPNKRREMIDFVKWITENYEFVHLIIPYEVVDAYEQSKT